MTLSPDGLTSSPTSFVSLSFTNDPTKWLTHVTSCIDLGWSLHYTTCPGLSQSIRPMGVIVVSPSALNRCGCFEFVVPFAIEKKEKRRGIISRQSTCLPLHSSAIKLVQSITWAYWLESSAVERVVCKINALFSLRLAFLMLVYFFLFLSVRMWIKQERSQVPQL